VAAGHAVIADATFMHPEHRRAIAAAAGKAPFHGVWLTAPLAEMRARVAGRRGDASDADEAVLLRAARGDPGAGDWQEVAAGAADHPVAAIALIMAHNNPM
jgi:predicted kinase